MPGGPDRPRADSRARAAQAFDLKCKGWTWRDIATELGYRSHAGAISAVRQHLARQPTENQDILRAYTGGSYRIVTTRLHKLHEKLLAKVENETELTPAELNGTATAAATVARAIADVEDKHAKLTGQYTETKPDVEVNVNVTGLTPTAVIGEAESNLIAIAKARRANMPAIAAPPAEILDAEIVEAK